MMDLTNTIEADSTQVNADDLAGPRIVTITGVNKGTADQPVNIELAEFPGKSYRPCKSMRRVLVHCWGADASTYIGRRLEIYNDHTVRWGGQAVGGVRIKALSHISKSVTLALTETRGKKAPYKVDPLPDAPAAITDDEVNEYENQIALVDTLDDLKALYEQLKSVELGSHRAALTAAVTARKAEIENAAAEQPTLDATPAE